MHRVDSCHEQLLRNMDEAKSFPTSTQISYIHYGGDFKKELGAIHPNLETRVTTLWAENSQTVCSFCPTSFTSFCFLFPSAYFLVQYIHTVYIGKDIYFPRQSFNLLYLQEEERFYKNQILFETKHVPLMFYWINFRFLSETWRWWCGSISLRTESKKQNWKN